jgi:hypothetical protein
MEPRSSSLKRFTSGSNPAGNAPADAHQKGQSLPPRPAIKAWRRAQGASRVRCAGAEEAPPLTRPALSASKYHGRDGETVLNHTEKRRKAPSVTPFIQPTCNDHARPIISPYLGQPQSFLVLFLKRTAFFWPANRTCRLTLLLTARWWHKTCHASPLPSAALPLCP